jgi:hypothetical protein
MKTLVFWLAMCGACLAGEHDFGTVSEGATIENGQWHRTLLSECINFNPLTGNIESKSHPCEQPTCDEGWTLVTIVGPNATFAPICAHDLRSPK